MLLYKLLFLVFREGVIKGERAWFGVAIGKEAEERQETAAAVAHTPPGGDPGREGCMQPGSSGG